MYLVFIDFRIFFESFDRNALLYKLLKRGVTGKIYYIIKDMYKGTNYHIKCQGFDTLIQTNTWSKTGLLPKPNPVKYLSK